MNHRRVAAVEVLAFALTLGIGAGSPAGSQTRATGTTPDGQPDIQGMWLYFDNTPFETPGAPTRRRVGEAPELAGTSDLLQRAAAERRGDTAGGANPFYTEAPLLARAVSQRPSLVVDPPDGKVPVLEAAVQKNNQRQDHFSDSYIYLNSHERCITWGVPGRMFPNVNASVRIVQGPGQVALISEMGGVQMVPLDGGPHLPPNIRLWTGDSRGRWEGRTLVIDTTNYNAKGSVLAAANRLQGIEQSEALHVVERLTPVDADTINYEVVIEDPNVFARPWTVARPLRRDDSYGVFEYTCHEGNRYYMNIVLGGGRLKDRGPDAEAAIVSPSRAAAEAAARSTMK